VLKGKIIKTIHQEKNGDKLFMAEYSSSANVRLIA